MALAGGIASVGAGAGAARETEQMARTAARISVLNMVMVVCR